MKKAFLLGFFIFLFSVLNSQTLILEGKQVFNTQTQKAEFVGKELVLPLTCKIVKIETNAEGFWIQSEGNVILSVNKIEGEFKPDPVGQILKPGKYKVYPNLKTGEKSTYVRIYLEPVF